MTRIAFFDLLEARPLRLHILHTNDVHSAFSNYAKVAYRLKRLREQWLTHREPVLVFDLGDHADLSNPLSLATSGRVNADLIGALPYDGFVLGNNETVTIDQHVWPDLIKRTHTPLYCSNLYIPGADHSLTGSYIYPLGELRLGVFGVTVRYEKLFNNLRLCADDPVETAWQVAQDLREKGAHIVILLSHLGLFMDKILARDGLPVDLIISSHTHQFLENGVRIGDTLIAQAGKHARALGHVQLEVSSSQRIEQAEAELLYVSEEDAMDEVVLKVVRQAEERAAVWLDAPIATVTPPLVHLARGESEIVNLLCDQMRAEFHVDVALINGGIITADLKPGIILRRDLLHVCATPMRVITMRMTGALLWKLISEGLRPELFDKHGYGFGFRGDTIGRIHLSGAVVTTAGDEGGSHAAAARTVTSIIVGGEPLELDRTYAVATGEYIALSPDIAVPKDAEFYYQETMLRDLLRRGLENPQRIEGARKHRYLGRNGKP